MDGADSILKLFEGAYAAARAGRAAEAQSRLARIALSSSLSGEVLEGLGMLHYMSGNARAAADALELAPAPSYEALLTLSAAYTALGDREHAAAVQQEANALRSTSPYCAEDILDDGGLEQVQLPAMARRNCGPHMRLLALGDFKAYGEHVIQRAAELPDYARGVPLLRLRSGKMLKRWSGERVERLAVMFPDGHGDTFCFGRYLSGLRGRAGHVTAILSGPVRLLVKRSAPGIECVPLDDCSGALDAADAYVDQWALSWISGEGSGAPAWISADGVRADSWRPRDPGPHVGVAWGGSNWNQWDSLRSISPHMLAGLLAVPDVTWHSLQVGPKAGECPAIVRDHSAEIASFHDTAALIAGLDLVISVDTAVANLAGAMGAPVWVMVERENDFRWGVEGERTPWFPSARVFRQSSSGGWVRVIRRVRVALETVYGAGRARRGAEVEFRAAFSGCAHQQVEAARRLGTAWDRLSPMSPSVSPTFLGTAKR